MNIGIVGCGYVSYFYAATLGHHPELMLAGAFDRDRANLDRFVQRHPTRAYSNLAEMLSDPQVTLVLNLTNPRDHLGITRACLDAGKHVYSEKPLAMTGREAAELVSFARTRGRQLSSAPCSVLSETAQTLWKAIAEGAIGKVRLAYANFEDGILVPAAQPWTWTNEGGVAWPAKDEYEVGCTYEHAGYALTWLCAFFGPARAVTGFASCLVPDKGIPVDQMAPDFSVGCLEFGNGIVARLTCGLVAPEDKSLTVVGDEGTLSVANLRDESAPVILRRAKPGRWRAGLARRLPWLPRSLFDERYPMVKPPSQARVGPGKPVDFLRGPAEMAVAIEAGRLTRLSPEFSAHIVEIVEALQFPERFGHHKALASNFEPMAPLHWSRA